MAQSCPAWVSFVYSDKASGRLQKSRTIPKLGFLVRRVHNTFAPTFCVSAASASRHLKGCH